MDQSNKQKLARFCLDKAETYRIAATNSRLGPIQKAHLSKRAVEWAQQGLSDRRATRRTLAKLGKS